MGNTNIISNDYTCFVITNHQDYKTYIFAKLPSNVDLERMKEEIKKIVIDGCDSMIEHGDAGFGYDSKDVVADAISTSLHDDNKYNIITSYNDKYDDLFANKDNMKQVDMYVNVLHYCTYEDDILIENEETPFDEAIKLVNNESPDEIEICDYRGERVGLYENGKFIPDEGIELEKDIRNCMVWYAIDDYCSFRVFVNTKARK